MNLSSVAISESSAAALEDIRMAMSQKNLEKDKTLIDDLRAVRTLLLSLRRFQTIVDVAEIPRDRPAANLQQFIPCAIPTELWTLTRVGQICDH